ncbi:hypothetical protein KSX_36940 [Ktedonospora formicarum]|uniref:SMP-30/Gluconolactonase/LRE-like region domain-containing protein n=1 Tax=Ktedonospora formicarum TaxID=2778364 RepID=A0A8J3HYK2_9CHLR|nr:hypothetical protein KSX_36940 [Ktedonospora formicarum]
MLSLLIVLLLSACSNSRIGQQTNGEQEGQPLTAETTGRFSEYVLPQSRSGLMRPAVDSQGRVWFSEMSRNYLSMFDPRSGAVQQMTPPGSAGGLMGVAVASDDTIWFAEESGNFIGHYNPQTRQFKNYSLPELTVPDPQNARKQLTLPLAPNELTFDAHGNLWFTELNADAVGLLNIKTGKIRQYPLASPPSVQKLNPYGLTLDRQGNIWVALSSSSQLVRLDPISGKIHRYPLPDQESYLMQVTTDRQGNIWASGFNKPLLLKFEPASERFTTYKVTSSANEGASGTIYDVVALANGDVWVTAPSENALARLDAKTRTFSFYRIPTAGAFPFGLTVTTDESLLWFTESVSDKFGSYRLA